MIEYIKKEDVVSLLAGEIRSVELTLETVTYKPTMRRLKVQERFLKDLLTDVGELKTVRTKPKRG